MKGVIDVHCHLNDERLVDRIEEIASGFSDCGIEACVCVGYDMPSSETAFALSGKFEKIYCAAGVHPHDSESVKPGDFDRLTELAADPKTVAIGEIGLDYFYDLSPRDIQRRVFAEQLELAHALKLPVILHIRDAYEDAQKILFDNKRYLDSGLMLHCYSGSAELVKIFGKLDAYYSFGGAITFKGARRNIEALSAVPIDRLTLETDCPYMTPVPFRGKTNVPEYIRFVAEKAAEIRGLKREELAKITTENAKRLFTKLI